MIQDVIQYLDDEDDEGIIVFMDQQKTCDGVEWHWVDCVLNIQILVINLGDGSKIHTVQKQV
jgi:hypothetical protein